MRSIVSIAAWLSLIKTYSLYLRHARLMEIKISLEQNSSRVSFQRSVSTGRHRLPTVGQISKRVVLTSSRSAFWPLHCFSSSSSAPFLYQKLICGLVAFHLLLHFIVFSGEYVVFGAFVCKYFSLMLISFQTHRATGLKSKNTFVFICFPHHAFWAPSHLSDVISEL